MARGYPDYANPVYLLASRNLDFGILQTIAVGIASIDGMGRMEWGENFREGLSAWTATKVGNGVNPYIHTLHSLIPPVSCAFNFGTLAGGGNAQIYRFGYYNGGVSLGLEFSMSWLTADANWIVQLFYDDGTTEYQATFKLNMANGRVYIFSGGAYQLIGDVFNYNDLGFFTRFKLVCNYQTGYYERLLAGMEKFDLSAYPIPPVDSTQQGVYYIRFLAEAAGAAVDPCNLGHVVLTTDEP